MRLILYILLFCLTLLQVSAIPIFEVVNDYDKNGQACPLFAHNNVNCPLLCVENHIQCPLKLAPSCRPGLSFCGDGTCKPSCDGIENACGCGTSATHYVPCAGNQLVNISHFDPIRQEKQIQSICQMDANITVAPDVWGTSNSAVVWLTCPVVEPYFTWKEPMWIVIWAIMVLEALILITWDVYKRIKESIYKSKQETESSYDPKMDEAKQMYSDSASHNTEKICLCGYENNLLGWIAYVSVIVFSWLLIVFLACIVSDYYGALNGVELGVFLSIDLSSKVFVVVWHITAAWLLVLILHKSRFRNYFRIESYINSSPYIQVEYKKDELIFLDDGNKWVAKLQYLEKKVSHYLGSDILVTTCPVVISDTGKRWFEYQCMRYVFQREKGYFSPNKIDVGNTKRILIEQKNGITTELATERLHTLGPNIIKVEIPSIFIALVQEFASPIYLYQLMCEWIWYYFQYYKMGIVQTGIILTSAFIRIFLRLRAEHRIKKMSEHISKVTLLRDGKWISDISTGNIVPGDVFQVEENTIIPCDAVLLSGTVVVNESALTGEAMPVRKFPISNDDTPYEKDGSSKINTLFAGTCVSQVIHSPAEGRVFALATHTGIASEKGTLIHKILFPTPISFIFNEHIKVAIAILLVWAFVGFLLTLYLIGFDNITSWFYGMFIISEVFSPLLPAAFTINQSVCAARLRTKKIICIDLPRINLSGKVRIFCFDKTGTLTREGLEFYGGVVTSGEKKAFTPCEEDPLKLESNLATGIATCHAVTKLKDQFIGNPVDIESFRAMKWDLLPPADSQYLDTMKGPSSSPNEKEKLVHVIRRFEFVHARASQSVAVLDEQTQHVHVYLKGSFERVKYLSAPDSIPEQYDEEAAKYAQEGCYVLAMSHRDLGVLGKDITMEQVKTMTRDELEQDCQFTGFILFRNMLKHDTAEAIAELKGGDTRVVMITGDTALTGIFIARQCGMISSSQRVILGDFVSGAMVWRDVDSGESVDVDKVIEQDLHEPHEKNIELALTGRGFEALIAQDRIRNYLLMTRVFARMTPNDKVICVQLHMEKGVTAMCGDGGNDCGALRAAHVGLALSEAEASIVSPFSTNNRSIMQCVELLRQGRSALATSFANYKFLIFYGEIMGFFELIMFYFSANAPESVWVFIDGAITASMTFAITQARPAKRLNPSRPTAKPLGVYTLASILGVVFIDFWFLCCSMVWLFQQDWFICNEFDSSAINMARWWLLGDNYEIMIISLVAMFQLFTSGALVNFGTQFRQSWWRNYPLVFLYVGFFTMFSYVILADPNPLGCLFRSNCGTPSVLVSLGYPEPSWYISSYNSPVGHNVLPRWFRWEFWGYILANSACVIIWERVCILWIARDWAIKRTRTTRTKDRAVFKL